MIEHTSSDRLTDEAHAEHIVQFHAADDGALIGNVARYLAGALEQGDVALVVGTPQHIGEFARALGGRGIDVDLLAPEALLAELPSHLRRCTKRSSCQHFLNRTGVFEAPHSPASPSQRTLQCYSCAF